MTIQLRKSEVNTIVVALEGSLNPDYPNTDPYNAAALRLIKKFKERP